ncbi:MAG TPA: hypothetical protein PKX05_03440 [bacterium]|nr:hypothetical protein [bacterium]
MDIVLLLGLIMCVGGAVLIRDMLKAAISLLISSIILGVIFFTLHAGYAGVFEISVVAGLIMVLFIMTISLLGENVDIKEPAIPLAVFIVLFFGFSAIIIPKILCLPQVPDKLLPVEPLKIGEVLWIHRTFDIIGQIAAIFAGVFVLFAVVNGRGKHGK